MKALLALAVVALAACTAPPSPRCVGMPGKPMLTAELYFGRSVHGRRIDDVAWAAFLAEAVTPRFPEGLTVLEGYGQWHQDATGLVRSEPSTVVVIVADPGGATVAALEAIRADYRRRFHQESVGLTLTGTCGSF